MNAIILAAGVGRRLQPMGWNLPKCLLPCPGGTLLDNTLSALSRRGITRIAIVVGYKHEQVKTAASKHGLHIDFVINEEYATTNTLHSLHLARHFLRDGAILFNGDVWFRDSALARFTPLPLRERGRGEGEEPRIIPTLLIVNHPCGPEEVKVIVDADNRVERIGKDLDPRSASGEFIGIAHFDAATGAALADNLEQSIAAGHSSQFFEFSLNHILGRHAVHAAFINAADAIEIDTPEDYAAAQRRS